MDYSIRRDRPPTDTQQNSIEQKTIKKNYKKLIFGTSKSTPSEKITPQIENELQRAQSTPVKKSNQGLESLNRLRTAKSLKKSSKKIEPQEPDELLIAAKDKIAITFVNGGWTNWTTKIKNTDDLRKEISDFTSYVDKGISHIRENLKPDQKESEHSEIKRLNQLKISASEALIEINNLHNEYLNNLSKSNKTSSKKHKVKNLEVKPDGTTKLSMLTPEKSPKLLTAKENIFKVFDDNGWPEYDTTPLEEMDMNINQLLDQTQKFIDSKKVRLQGIFRLHKREMNRESIENEIFKKIDLINFVEKERKNICKATGKTIPLHSLHDLFTSHELGDTIAGKELEILVLNKERTQLFDLEKIRSNLSKIKQIENDIKYTEKLKNKLSRVELDKELSDNTKYKMIDEESF